MLLPQKPLCLGELQRHFWVQLLMTYQHIRVIARRQVGAAHTAQEPGAPLQHRMYIDEQIRDG
jgi:hypothetical protein